MSLLNLYTVQMALGQLTTTSLTTGAVNTVDTHIHPKTQCRLYIPEYIFSPSHELSYLSKPQHVHNYTDVLYSSYTVQPGGTIYFPITANQARMKRLIIIGVLDASANEGVSPFSSPFTTEPSTTSPFMVKNLQINFGGGNNLYTNVINYTYEHYLNEMNGEFGVNANRVVGACSSRISQVDFNNNYHYIVANLDRRLAELENTDMSLTVTGTLTSLKAVTFHCYLEYMKTITIDVSTGSLVA